MPEHTVDSFRNPREVNGFHAPRLNSSKLRNGKDRSLGGSEGSGKGPGSKDPRGSAHSLASERAKGPG